MSYSLETLSKNFHKDFGKPAGGKHFSKIIFPTWSRYGEALGYIVLHSKSEKSEYLVDLCWMKETSDARWMELALESEVSKSTLEGIKEDFVKLLDIKAKKKVGIFKPILSIKEKAIEMISSLISTQKIILEGEKYLIFFIVYLGNQVDPEKNCEVTSYEINDEGKVKQLQVSYTSIID